MPILTLSHVVVSPFFSNSARCFCSTLLAIVAFATSVEAEQSQTARLCDLAARTASEARGVPYDVLAAVSRAETGRSIGSALHPWPWTVNMEGAGKWFSNEDEARAYVFKHFKRGARSFDVGCFQVNYKWHGAAFRSIDDMFDPVLNADYAAEFLSKLFAEFGDWTLAVGAYHSRTLVHAKSYTSRFEEIRNTMSVSEYSLADGDGASRSRSKPSSGGSLISRMSAPLFGGGSALLGSLVPVSSESGSPRRAFVVIN